MTINELLTLLSSANSGVLIWLCFDRDRLNERIDKQAAEIDALRKRVQELESAAAEQGWNAAIDQAAAIVLADCVNPPKTEYQVQYNATLKSTAAQILKLKEST